MKFFLSRIGKLVKKVAEITILALAIFYIGKFIYQGWPQVVANIEYAKWSFVFLGFCLFFVYFLLRSWAWQLIMRLLGADLSFQKASYIWFLSEFSRYVPGNVWSFLGRVYLSSNERVPKKITSVSLILEIFYLLGSSLTLGVVFFLVNPTQDFHIPKWLVFLAIIIILVLINPKIFLKIINKLLSVLKKKSLEINLNFIQSTTLFILYIIIWITYGLASYFIAKAFVRLDGISIIWLVCSFVLAWAVGYLSFITPMGLGVREATMVTILKAVTSTSLASLIALVTRIFLIFSELIMLGLITIISKIKNHSNYIKKIKDYLKNNKYEVLLWCLVAAYFIYFVSLTFLRHANFLSSRYDLGNMDQTVWSTAHGYFFQLTNPEVGTQVSRFTIHGDVFLVLLAPLYWILPSPYTLLFVQTAVVALGALPTYWLAKDVLKNKALALVLAFSYLMYPGTQWANIFDFHSVTLATSFLMFAFYFAYKKNYISFIIFSLLAISTKETVAFSIAMIAIYIILVQKNWKFGSLVGLVSLAWFGLLLGKVMPEARVNSEAHFALGYYKYFGNTPKEIFRTLFSHPAKAFDYVSINNRWYYFLLLYAPTGFLGIFTPLVLMALPQISLNVLSDQWQMSSINYQYTSDIAPFIFIATIFGLAWVIKFIKKIYLARGINIPTDRVQKVFIFYLITVILICSWIWSPLPLAKHADTLPWTYRHTSKKYLTELSKEIPKDYAVSATNRMSPHFTERRVSYLFPNGIGKAEYIVVEKNYPIELGTTEDVQQKIAMLEKDDRYTRIYTKDNVEVFKKKGVK